MKRVWILFLLTTPLWGRMLHVPSPSFPTIQAALDSLAAHDTVLVALGTYAEALQAPPIAFVLKGDVVADTGDYPRPVIDPAPLPGSDSLSCLKIPADAIAQIEDIRFRNGAAMYPHVTFVGGIVMVCAQATFWRCVFDSLFGGIAARDPSNPFSDSCGSATLQDCRFLDVNRGVSAWSVWANHCLFSGGRMPVVAFGNAWLENCQFSGNTEGTLCNLYENIHVAHCQFGPCPPGQFILGAALQLSGPNGVVDDNLFTGLNLQDEIIGVSAACDGIAALAIRGNLFTNIVARPPNGSTGIVISRRSGSTGDCSVAIDSNSFKDNHNSQMCRGVLLGTDGEIIGNRFRRLGRDTSYHDDFPAWAVILLAGQQSAGIHGNWFDSTGIAFWDFRSFPYDTADLRENWWGSATGPYHGFFNPQGLGDTVLGNYIWLAPWCTDTISCYDSILSASLPFFAHPSTFLLSAYPNPFNSTTVLHLEVPEPQIVRIELFDLLGRRVQELWSGVIADRKEIAFDGSALASGIYFVRATNTIWNRPLITAKLVLLK